MYVTLSVGLKLHIPKHYIVQANDISKKKKKTNVATDISRKFKIFPNLMWNLKTLEEIL